MCKHSVFFIHSSAAGCLGCFRILAGVSHADVTVGVQTSRRPCSHSCGVCSQKGDHGTLSQSFTLTLSGSRHVVSVAAAQPSVPAGAAGGSCLSMPWPAARTPEVASQDLRSEVSLSFLAQCRPHQRGSPSERNLGGPKDCHPAVHPCPSEVPMHVGSSGPPSRGLPPTAHPPSSSSPPSLPLVMLRYISRIKDVKLGC